MFKINYNYGKRKINIMVQRNIGLDRKGKNKSCKSTKEYELLVSVKEHNHVIKR